MDKGFWGHINDIEFSHPTIGYIKWCADLKFLKNYLLTVGFKIDEMIINDLLEKEYANPTEFSHFKLSKKKKGVWCFEIII